MAEFTYLSGDFQYRRSWLVAPADRGIACPITLQCQPALSIRQAPVRIEHSCAADDASVASIPKHPQRRRWEVMLPRITSSFSNGLLRSSAVAILFDDTTRARPTRKHCFDIGRHRELSVARIPDLCGRSSHFWEVRCRTMKKPASHRFGSPRRNLQNGGGSKMERFMRSSKVASFGRSTSQPMPVESPGTGSTRQTSQVLKRGELFSLHLHHRHAGRT